MPKPFLCFGFLLLPRSVNNAVLLENSFGSWRYGRHTSILFGENLQPANRVDLEQHIFNSPISIITVLWHLKIHHRVHRFPPLDLTLIQFLVRHYFGLIYQQDRRCTYNVTLKLVGTTIVAVEKR